MLFRRLYQQLGEAALGYSYLLCFRWLAWFVALFQSSLELPVMAPAHPLLPWLIITGVYNIGITLAWIHNTPFEQRLLRSNWLVCFDTAALLILTVATGGWHSPFYQYSFSAFILLSYHFGIRGALASGALLIAWHLLIALTRSSSLVIIASTTMASISVGAALIIAAYMIKVVEEQRQVVRQQATREERLRMAHYVHDETVQQMYGVIMALKGTIAHIKPGPDRAQLQSTLDLAVQSWDDLRCFLQDLRTPADEAPLSESLQRRAAEFTRLTGLPVQLKLPASESPLSFETRTRMGAIMREALSNVYRHARATTVWIELRIDNDRAILEIADDGVGFDPTNVNETNGHYGLASIDERVAAMGGQLRIESAPGQGTRIIVRVPLDGAS